MTPLSRRDLIIGASATVGGLVAGGVVVGLSTKGAVPSPSITPPVEVSVDRWLQERRAPYYIGHRGAGGVVPEHTIPSYLQALQWGADCIEISVVLSADRVLYCLHDLTLDRTTTMTGVVRSMPSAELDKTKVAVPRLGPRWTGANMPAMPRLADVLTEVGGKAVLCIEPKDDDAYPPLMEMIAARKLENSVIIKLDASSPRIEMAKGSGFPVFAYLGNAQAATVQGVTALAKRLDPRRDVLVLPARDGHKLMPPKVFQTAVGTGVPTWVFPVHRRSEAKYFSLLGVQGLVTPSIGYLSAELPPVRSDNWAAGELSPGELTRDPYSNAFAISWVEEAAITIQTPGRQAFVTLAQFSPIQAASYRIAFDLRFNPLPSDTWQHASISFCHADDSYYEHRLGADDGYHALLRADGTMGLYAHTAGEQNGQELAKSKQSTPMKPGVWARVTLDVTPTGFQWARDDGTTLAANDQRFRGGYFHIGSSATDGAIQLRNLTVA